jgi:hypothetical protein
MNFKTGFEKTAIAKIADGFLGGKMMDAAIAAKKAVPKPPAAPAVGSAMSQAFGSIRSAFGGS